MIGTSGCIGAGIDCDDISLVARLGMPTSLMHLIQEMGRCGRNTSGEYQNILNCYHIIFTLKDFVYLNERLFYEDKCDDEMEETSDAVIQNDDKDDIVSLEEHRLMMQKSLHRCAQLMTLNIGCWHELLENECGCPQVLMRNEFTYQDIIGCNGKCPRCDGSMQIMIQPVLRNGLTMFLIDAFGDNYSGKVTPIQLPRQLFQFENVGEVVYNRPSSKKAKSLQVTEITVLQLIAANLIRIEVDTSEKKPIVHCKLCFDKNTVENSNAYMQPHYLIDKYWDNIIKL